MAKAASSAAAVVHDTSCSASRAVPANRQVLNKPCFSARTFANLEVSVELKCGSPINLISESVADDIGVEILVDDFAFYDYLADSISLHSLL